jgi:hypothetical protein
MQAFLHRPHDPFVLALCPIIVGNRVSHSLAIASRNTLLSAERGSLLLSAP